MVQVMERLPSMLEAHYCHTGSGEKGRGVLQSALPLPLYQVKTKRR
jgi:hypothetical protein